MIRALAADGVARDFWAFLVFDYDRLRHMKILALGMLMTIGAFAQKIEIEFDQAVDFTRFHTFAIREARLNSKNPSLNSELIRKNINTYIKKYLGPKGWSSSNPAHPISTFATRWVRRARPRSIPTRRAGEVGERA